MRVQFGKPIAANQAIQWMLADMATDIYASRSMLYHAAWKADQGMNFSIESAMFKLFASEMVCRCADKALQIHGGMGYMKDLVIERIYRDARLLRIVDGTSEIQRIVISRSVLKD
jgi:acyl-CoA dehydrogenase